MRNADVIVLGAGIIGLSLSLELRKRGLNVLILERSEPAREATHAAAGMLTPQGGDLPPSLQALATESAKIYPEFVQEVEDASDMQVDFRTQGTILFAEGDSLTGARCLNTEELRKLEPNVQPVQPAYFINEASVDPRQLGAALLQAALHHGIELANGSEVRQVASLEADLEVRTSRAHYSAASVVNCCGAWAGSVGPVQFPTRPIKGQMLSIVADDRKLLAHVVHAKHVYLVPRSDGRILIGATVENAGFDKQVIPDVIKSLYRRAAELVPEVAKSKIHESWAGLRPGTVDDLPIIGATSVHGYFVATGHFRNGILLAPITAKLMATVICGEPVSYDIDAFASSRFSS